MLNLKQYILFLRIRHRLILLYKLHSFFLPQSGSQMSNIIINYDYVTLHQGQYTQSYILSQKGIDFTRNYLSYKDNIKYRTPQYKSTLPYRNPEDKKWRKHNNHIINVDGFICCIFMLIGMVINMYLSNTDIVESLPASSDIVAISMLTFWGICLSCLAIKITHIPYKEARKYWNPKYAKMEIDLKDIIKDKQ